jgi:integrase
LLRDYKLLLKAAGLPVMVVSRRLGHAKASITLDICEHLIPGMQEEAANLMDELVTPVELPSPVTDKHP